MAQFCMAPEPKLLLALPLPALRCAEFCAARLISAGHGAGLGLARLGLLEVVLGDPLLLVTSSSSCSDSADRGAGSWYFTLLGLRDERKVAVVAGAAEQTKDNSVGNPPKARVSL